MDLGFFTKASLVVTTHVNIAPGSGSDTVASRSDYVRAEVKGEPAIISFTHESKRI